METTDHRSTITRLNLRAHNPDVLNTIANLSNDEVFTPPELANKMLDTLEVSWSKATHGANIWADPTVKFLDPFTKSGVFLREITSRLVRGLENWMPDLQQRVDHILTQQVFGMGITRLTSLLARRTVYCSKDATGPHSVARTFDREWGNIWFERTDHTWIGGTTTVMTADRSGNTIRRATDGRCKYCGASQLEYERNANLETHAYSFIHTEDINAHVNELFGDEMHFDVIIGNPPYQLSDGGHGVSAAPIYHHFIEQAKQLDPRFLTMVVPARWYSGGKGLDKFRASMLEDDRLTVLHDFPDSREVFPDVDIAGGICYFVWTRDQRGDAEITSHRQGVQSTSIRPLLEPGSDIFIRHNEAIDLLKKINAVERGVPFDEAQVGLPPNKQFASIVSSRKPFGLGTNYRGAQNRSRENKIQLVRSGEINWISETDLQAGEHLVDKWKVFTSKASHDHAGQPGKDGKRKVLARTEVIAPGTVVTESYILLGTFEERSAAENCLSYAQTRFFRFLVSLRSSTQDITKTRFSFVPLQDFSKAWSDEALYSKYGLTPEEVELIENMIRPMELNNG